MAYTKTNWVNGQTPINATNLNKIENGIAENDTAINNINTSINNLTNISFCKMNTNFAYKTITEETTIEGWEGAVNIGDYIADTVNNRLIIKNTELLQLSGMICGIGNATIDFVIKESDGTKIGEVGTFRTLVTCGSDYWSANLKNVLVPLDKTKIYHITLVANKYGTDKEFSMNNGFGKYGTEMAALKIK